ncbi:MAG: prolipoprotein diacylglyceryl transferase [Eubacteriaceae bacterium]|nr:prolipoprotein diacylglyceryl transferase [Eubacteriaceae bacterium]
MRAPDPIAFSILGIDIRWYGILIGIGFILAIWLSYRRAPRYGINSDNILDLAVFIIPVSLVCARLYYVIFNWSYYAGDFMAIINTRNGGLAIHGGVIGGIIVALILCHRNKISFLNLADLIFPTVALAQSIGRWGNFFNSEAHGGPTDLPWAIEVNGQMVHPTFLYESLWCLALFIFLSLLGSKRKFTGQIACMYGILYSTERILVEQLRTDSLMIGPFKQAQVLSLCVIIICLGAYWILMNKENKKQKRS